MSEYQKIRKKANQYFFSKLIFIVVLVIWGAIMMSALSSDMNRRQEIHRYEQTGGAMLEEVMKNISVNEETAVHVSDTFDSQSRGFVHVIADILSADEQNVYMQEEGADPFAALPDDFEADALFLIDQAGNLIAAKGQSAETVWNSCLKEGRDALIRENPEPMNIYTDSASFRVYAMNMPSESGNVLAAAFDTSILNAHLQTLSNFSIILKDAASGGSGFLFSIDRDTQIFTAFDDGENSMIDQTFTDAGLSSEILNDGYAGKEMINGTEYYVISRSYNDNTVICSAAKMDTVLSGDWYILYWSVSGFVLIMVLCLLYAIIVRNDFIRNKTETDKKILIMREDNPVYFDRSVFRKVSPLMISGAVLIFIISYYAQSLLEISQAVNRAERTLDDVVLRYEDSSVSHEDIINYFENRYLDLARMIAVQLEQDPSALNEESDRYYSYFDKYGERRAINDDEGNPLKCVSGSSILKRMADSDEVGSIFVFDEDGRTIATSSDENFFTLSHDPQSDSSPFIKVLSGECDQLIHKIQEEDTGTVRQYAAAAFYYRTAKDETGQTIYLSSHETESAYSEVTKHRSLIRIGLHYFRLAYMDQWSDTDIVLSSDLIGDGAIMMFDTDEAHTCTYGMYESQEGKTAEELGISPHAFEGEDYYGFGKLGSETYFQYFRYYEYLDRFYAGVMMPKDTLYHSRLTNAFIASVFSLILILILIASVAITSREEEILFETIGSADEKSRMDSAIFNIILPGGQRSTTIKAAARWDNRRIPWDECSPEQKLLRILGAACSVLMIYSVIVIIGSDRFFAKTSIFHYILSQRWDRGINIFAISACGMVLLSVFVLLSLIRLPARVLQSLFGTRGETLSHLLISVFRYGGLITSIFWCLYYLGVDSLGILASAGLLTLIIGLGAQSLIKDILAGIFIVFEGEFRVGDIVTVNGYRGRVADIGLRTTKVMGFDGNVKIFANSEISGVLNMTKASSIAASTISIEYGQDIGYVEEVLKRELPLLKEENQKILDGPVYGGISSLGDSGVGLTVICWCEEADILGVTRYLNRSLLEIFYRNHINVPYPHVTLDIPKTDDQMKDDSDQ